MLQASTGAIASATATTAGTQILASQTTIDSDGIVAGQPTTGTGGELLLTLSAHKTVLTFVDATRN